MTTPTPLPMLPNELRAFIDAVVIPALLQRLMNERSPRLAA